MSLLKVGEKPHIFVTHVEFVGSTCEVFGQIGDVGGQADTLAERIAEVIETGSASQVSGCGVGELCLALFHEDNSWYRGRVKALTGQSVTVFFIDYGNTETVHLSNIRKAPESVLCFPALSSKCVVKDCRPLTNAWTEEEKKKNESLLVSAEFSCEIVAITRPDANNMVYEVKLYTLDAPNTPVFVRPASGGSQTLNYQSFNPGQEVEVFLAYVESSKRFFVQLKSQENELNSLMYDISACFAEDLPMTGDIVNPVNGQVCAACFSEDGAFYRGVVKDIKGGRCTVHFVDYGNSEEKSTSELFTLPQALCKLPVQGVLCSYKSVPDSIENALHALTSAEKPSRMKIVSGNPSSGYVVELDAIEKQFGRSLGATSVQGATSVPTSQSKPRSKLWESYSSVIMQVDSIYDVCVSHVNHPGQFYVQLLGNAQSLDSLMQAIYEVAHNYDKLTNLYAGYQCLAQFSDGSWYRAEVVAAEVGKVTCAAVDFGIVETISPTQLRNTDVNFKPQPAQAIQCSLDINRLGSNSWTGQEIARFVSLVNGKSLVAKVTGRQGVTFVVELYDSETEKNIYSQFGQSQSSPRATSQPVPRAAQSSPVKAAPRVTIPAPEVTLGSKYTLCFTALKAPYLYGQVTHTPIEQITKLQTDLQNFFTKNPGEALSNASVGSVCCTKYVDGGWYRGMITELNGNKATVAFVDFGDSVDKMVGELKNVPGQLTTLAQQCLLCKPDNIPASTPQSKLETSLLNNKVEVKLTRQEGRITIHFSFSTLSIYINVLNNLVYFLWF